MNYINGFCTKCGAHIYPNRQRKHTEFHTEHEELIEWAQSVSKLFSANDELFSEEATASKGSGKKLYEHDAIGLESVSCAVAEGYGITNGGEYEAGKPYVFNTESSENELQEGPGNPD